MNDQILITELNDFVFCPVSIYFHKLYGDAERALYQSSYQINGSDAHKSIDNNTYSSKLTGDSAVILLIPYRISTIE